jgi:hypothetical protein
MKKRVVVKRSKGVRLALQESPRDVMVKYRYRCDLRSCIFKILSSPNLVFIPESLSPDTATEEMAGQIVSLAKSIVNRMNKELDAIEV